MRIQGPATNFGGGQDGQEFFGVFRTGARPFIPYNKTYLNIFGRTLNFRIEP